MRGWRQVWLVALREIQARARTRAYQLSTVAVVLVAAGGVVASQALPDVFDEDPIRLGLAPDAVGLEPALREAGTAVDRELELVTYASDEEATRALGDEAVDAVLLAPDRLRFAEESDATLQTLVSQALFQSTLEERARAIGITVEEARSLVSPVPVETDVTSPEDADEVDGERGGFGVGFLSSIVLLMGITIYGQWVLVGVIEEKSNRVVEILLAAIEPWQLMTGKVLGILALAVGQLFIGLAALLAAALAVYGPDEIPTLAAAGVAMGAFWLVLGLLLYNFMYAAAGATVNRPEEATSVTSPMLVPLMGGYFGALILIPQDPDSIGSRILSIFPLTAPLSMPARVAAGGGSAFDVILAATLTIATLVGVIWLASRIYTGGVLQTSRVGFLTAIRRSRELS